MLRVMDTLKLILWLIAVVTAICVGAWLIIKIAPYLLMLIAVPGWLLTALKTKV